MTQPDINVAVDFAIQQDPKGYCTNRPIQEYASCYDCSALVIAGLMHAGVVVPPGISNTVDIYNWARRVGGLVSVTQGVGTRGAIMLRGRWYGYGPLGHASFSLGNGRQFAAHNRRIGIGESRLDPSFFQDAVILPGVDYHITPPIDWVKIKQLDDWRKRVTRNPLHYGERGTDIKILNQALIVGGWIAKNNGVKYGKATRDGVVHLKRVRMVGNLDGKSFGGPAADALLGIK